MVEALGHIDIQARITVAKYNIENGICVPNVLVLKAFEHGVLEFLPLERISRVLSKEMRENQHH